MDNNKKIELEEEIRNIKKLNINQTLLTLKYVIEAYIKSFIIFGPSSKVTQEVKNIWCEFKKIIKEEKEIQDYILRNSTCINFYEAVELVDKLNEVNDDTIKYLYNSLDDILDACDTRFEGRMIQYPKSFKTLVETDEYRTSAVGLTLSFEDVKKYLNYTQEFWDYINPKIRRVSPDAPEKNKVYETIINAKSDDILLDMRVIVPTIVNLQTACINVHEFKHAYDLFQKLGQKINEKEIHYKEDAVDLEEEFKKVYVLKSFKNRV